jgi:cyclin-dependent kinase 8/11
MPIEPYKSKTNIYDRYKIVGFISAGTYGKVYKAISKIGLPGEFAIKKFKPDKEGEAQYTGISQSAIREMALCSELAHVNIIKTVEIILQDKCIFIVFEFAEHDLLKIYLFHSGPNNAPPAIPAKTLRSIMYQLLQGLIYLHRNWVIHRDLKPANIMVTANGQVRIGDLGLARLFRQPLLSLFTGDKVVVTIWYRAPELLLGSRHYTPAIDLWAIGCIFAELLSLRPIFKGEEVKGDSKKPAPFQRNQMLKIVEIVGMPTKDKWPLLPSMPEASQLNSLANSSARVANPQGLDRWYYAILSQQKYGNSGPNSPGAEGLDLLKGLFEYDPLKRLTAEQALTHKYFTMDSDVNYQNCLDGCSVDYPKRVVSTDDNDIRLNSAPGTKRQGTGGDSLRPNKRVKE